MTTMTNQAGIKYSTEYMARQAVDGMWAELHDGKQIKTPSCPQGILEHEWGKAIVKELRGRHVHVEEMTGNVLMIKDVPMPTPQWFIKEYNEAHAKATEEADSMVRHHVKSMLEEDSIEIGRKFAHGMSHDVTFRTGLIVSHINRDGQWINITDVGRRIASLLEMQGFTIEVSSTGHTTDEDGDEVFILKLSPFKAE